MKNHRIKISIFILLILAVVLAGGIVVAKWLGPADPYAVPHGKCRENTYEPDEKHVKYLGRSIYEKDSLWMVLSGTGAEFEFYGTRASILFYGDNTAMKLGGDPNSRARIAVYVNGERVQDFMMDELQKSVEVYASKEPKWCTVKVVKLSEAANSTAGIHSITVDSVGGIRPTKEKDYLIEIIGDSITCGYGVDDEDKNHHFSTTTEDITKTYGYLAAEKLNADYSFVSYSGYGVLSGYCITPGEPNTECTMGQYYDYVGNSAAYYRGSKAQETVWAFAKHPDVVVVNLGTNDASYTGNDPQKNKKFEAEYVAFLKQIRERNPGAHILCTLGIMGNGLYENIVSAVEDYTGETGDGNISCMEFFVQQESDGYGADWHPSFVTHRKAADRLADEIALILKQK